MLYKNDLDIINEIKSGVNVDINLKELINRHSGIYMTIANRYFSEERLKYADKSIDKNFIFGSKDYMIYDSAISFKPEIGVKFSTYLGNKTKFFCLNHINSLKKQAEHDFEQITQDSINKESEEEINSDLAKNIFELIKKIPDKRVYEIFKLRYLTENKKPTPWNTICKKIFKKNNNEHMSIQGCINIHDRAVKKIKENIKHNAII